MQTDTYVVALAVVLLLALAIAIVLARARKGRRCPVCGERVPRGGRHCPACGARISSATPQPKPPMLPAAAMELVALEGPLAPQRFALSAQGLTIGRHPDNDLVLTDEMMVSRYHAVITLEQGRHVLYDRDSANGTWVNEQRIFRHVLVPGDRIQIWRSLFAFAPAGTAALPSPPRAPAFQAPAMHVVGEHFDGYYLERLIGRGGMSEVFRARDPNGKTVAVKILQESNPYLVTKFVQEGNKIGPLLRGHPNIVYVYQFEQSHDGRLYLVMEYVDAPCLRKLLKRPLGEGEIVGIVGQVCNALAFAHQHQIVHRDIKPENILVTAQGTAKVLDFGIAKLTSAATVTRDRIVGTPEYISPEQARGDAVQPASDVYSLGVVMYEMLTGSVPFRRPNIEDAQKAAMMVIRQHLRERPEPIHRRNPGTRASDRVERVTMRALEKEIESRFKTAGEMGQALGCRMTAAGLPPPGAPRRAHLIVLQGARRGQRIRLGQGGLDLSRSLLDPANTAISRQHARIVFRGNGYWLEDLSKNGTWVDNQQVYGEIPLHTGSMVVIADNVLRLETENVSSWDYALS